MNIEAVNVGEWVTQEDLAVGASARVRNEWAEACGYSLGLAPAPQEGSHVEPAGGYRELARGSHCFADLGYHCFSGFLCSGSVGSECFALGRRQVDAFGGCFRVSGC